MIYELSGETRNRKQVSSHIQFLTNVTQESKRDLTFDAIVDLLFPTTIGSMHQKGDFHKVVTELKNVQSLLPELLEAYKQEHIYSKPVLSKPVLSFDPSDIVTPNATIFRALSTIATNPQSPFSIHPNFSICPDFPNPSTISPYPEEEDEDEDDNDDEGRWEELREEEKEAEEHEEILTRWGGGGSRGPILPKERKDWGEALTLLNHSYRSETLHYLTSRLLYDFSNDTTTLLSFLHHLDPVSRSSIDHISAAFTEGYIPSVLLAKGALAQTLNELVPHLRKFCVELWPRDLRRADRGDRTWGVQTERWGREEE